MKFWTLFTLILTSLTLEAKVFRNAYVAFELPDTWRCNLEHTEWVCRSESAKESREAIIILTAKEVGPTDSFDAYSQHLGTVQRNPLRPEASRVVYPPKQVKINDQVWIDGLHMGSEVVNYFTRYLATIKDRVAILVTYSAHKDFYTKYSPDFFKSIQSLKVIATKNILASPEGTALRPGSETLGQSINSAMPADIRAEEAMLNDGGKSKQSEKTRMLFAGIAVVVIGLGVYIFLKAKK